MGQILHGSAKTTHAVRAAIQRSKASIQELASRYDLNPKTVMKWRKRAFLYDAPMGPKVPRSTVLSAEEEALAVAFRKARLARHGHIAAHHARELAGDREAQPGAAVAARGQGIGLGEILKQFCLLFRCHADTAIRDRKFDPVAAVRHLTHPQGDLTLLRELAGTAQEIE